MHPERGSCTPPASPSASGAVAVALHHQHFCKLFSLQRCCCVCAAPPVHSMHCRVQFLYFYPILFLLLLLLLLLQCCSSGCCNPASSQRKVFLTHLNSIDKVQVEHLIPEKHKVAVSLPMKTAQHILSRMLLFHEALLCGKEL